MSKFGTYVKPDCISCPQMKDVPEEDIQWLKDHNLILAVACSRCSFGLDTLELDDVKWLQERKLLLVSTCRDCSETFIITPEEAVWLLENELKLFKRCPSCRQKNRLARLAEEEAFEEDAAEESLENFTDLVESEG